MKISRNLAVVLIAVAMFTSCATTISGHVKSKQVKSPINYQDARVNITRIDEKSNGSNQVVTVDKSGFFKTENSLEKGEYLIEALVPGFSTESKKVTLKSSKNISLLLSPLESASSRSIAPNMNVDLGKGQGGATLMPPNL